MCGFLMPPEKDEFVIPWFINSFEVKAFLNINFKIIISSSSDLFKDKTKKKTCMIKREIYSDPMSILKQISEKRKEIWKRFVVNIEIIR